MSVIVATAYMEEADRFDWLVAMDDGKLLATKAGATPGALRAALPAGPGARTVVVLVEATAGAISGLLGTVSITPR